MGSPPLSATPMTPPYTERGPADMVRAERCRGAQVNKQTSPMLGVPVGLGLTRAVHTVGCAGKGFVPTREGPAASNRPPAPTTERSARFEELSSSAMLQPDKTIDYYQLIDPVPGGLSWPAAHTNRLCGAADKGPHCGSTEGLVGVRNASGSARIWQRSCPSARSTSEKR